MVTFQLPSGPLNLQALFPAIDFSTIDEYYLQLKDLSDNSIILTTNKVLRSKCCTNNIRVFFVNYLGGIDSVNLHIAAIETDIKSSRWKKALAIPLNKWDGGHQRLNVSAMVGITAETNDFQEEDQEWLEELKASPNAWVQWKGTQGHDDNYIPIVIEDGKFLKRKDESRYEYPFQLQFIMSNEKVILRN